ATLRTLARRPSPRPRHRPDHSARPRREISHRLEPRRSTAGLHQPRPGRDRSARTVELPARSDADHSAESLKRRTAVDNLESKASTLPCRLTPINMAEHADLVKHVLDAGFPLKASSLIHLFVGARSCTGQKSAGTTPWTSMAATSSDQRTFWECCLLSILCGLPVQRRKRTPQMMWM